MYRIKYTNSLTKTRRMKNFHFMKGNFKKGCKWIASFNFNYLIYLHSIPNSIPYNSEIVTIFNK